MANFIAMLSDPLGLFDFVMAGGFCLVAGSFAIAGFVSALQDGARNRRRKARRATWSR